MLERACRILVVDDEPAMREVLEARIERWGFRVRTAGDVATARMLVSAMDPHVVISDLVLPDATGLDLLEILRPEGSSRTVLLITAYGTIETAVQAIKAGATDFLTKPIDYVALKRHLEDIERRLAEEGGAQGGRPHGEGDPEVGLGGMVGRSPALVAMCESLRAAATSHATVLIVGESGSGKELVARTIHELSPRREGPFVPVNAAAVPEALAEGEFFGFERGAFTGAHSARAGLFERAHLGTLFLDEVTEMPAVLQPKFLRVLEDGNVRRLGGRQEIQCDVRVIAATNRNPAEAVADGVLRRDLLYRLDVLRVRVPPLRERKEDIDALVRHFLADCERRYGTPAARVTDDGMQALLDHAWPGNVRELKNVVERAFVVAQDGVIDAARLGFGAADRSASAAEPRGIVIPHGLTVAEAERVLILETLKRTNNNKAEAARRLGLDVKTIRNKLKAFEPGEPRA